MNWLDEQIQARSRLDEEQIEDAYARLAASVSGTRGPRFTPDDAAVADSAIDALMAYYGTKPAYVPDDITDPIERIDYAVRPTGVMRRPVSLRGKWWKDASGVYLATLRDGTPVAVIPNRMRGYCYVDPATERKVKINAKTAQDIMQQAVCFYRPLPQRELSLSDVGKFMMRSLAISDWVMVIVASAISTLIGLLPAIANNLLFKRIIPSGVPSLIVPIGALLLGMILSRSLIQITSATISERLSTKLRVQMEAATYARILLLPPTFFRDYAPGDLASRAMGMNRLVTTLTQLVIGGGITSLFSLTYVGQVLAYAPQLALPATIVVVAEVAISAFVTSATVQLNREQMLSATKLSGITPALLRGIQKIKLAGAERRAFSKWAHAYAEVSSKTYNRPALLLAAPTLVAAIGSVGTMIIYFLAATTKVSVADYMAFNVAFGAVSGAIASIADGATTAATIRPQLELVEPIMHSVPEALSNQRQITSVNGAIDVYNLSFSYEEKGPLVLNKLTLRIRAGEYVAIVGRTGCGKSTLMRLLLGFEKPNRGAIYYNGQDISSVDIRSLRKNIGVVMQNGSLFQGDLLMNITVAAPKATLDDAWEAAEMAGVADDIRKMPMGMHTIVGEGGGGISGGQRQRILIARAVCGRPKILMFDEATSALDNVTQRHVSDALEGLDCTRVVIAHRLSTIRNADRIIMLEGGAIVEDGTYEDLVAKGGKFAELVQRQLLEGE